MDEILDESCELLLDNIEDEYRQHLNELKLISNCVNNSNINVIDEPYDPKLDPEYNEILNNPISKSTRITRQTKKRQQERDEANQEDDDTLEQERTFSKINIRFNNIREQMESHEDFMLKLFGKRNNLEILNFEKYRDHQEGDNMTAIAIRLFKQPNRRKWKYDDWYELSQFEPELFDKLDNNKLLIENNILKCYDTDPVTKLEVKKIIVPSYLRGKLMDYEHHNILHHHFSYHYTYNKIARQFWWSNMKQDIKSFCRKCILCQFVKAGPKRRAPLIERQRPYPRQHIVKIQEPYVKATIITPKDYLGNIIHLLNHKRGLQEKLEYINETRVLLEYAVPMNEIIIDFYDKLKSISKGYASFDYELCDYRVGNLIRLDIRVAGEMVDALSLIVPKTQAESKARSLVKAMRELIDRQLFEVAIQASIGSKVIARETVKAIRKNVTAKCYGGDISRKRKLLEKQKEGKKRMKAIGRVNIPSQAFLSILKID